MEIRAAFPFPSVGRGVGGRNFTRLPPVPGEPSMALPSAGRRFGNGGLAAIGWEMIANVRRSRLQAGWGGH